eukprot:CAMPEP_0185790558 /NCGR_PEP_ID=MMETSP1174-20130828/157033_1 /TAXON_ID=35687 /ORGANISM="Dictyocha speculum, Strain CCMP1381" /LENGTH=91 /DNA_ID=CAMNT_0028485317 /DNA_START=29 /DNA_END=304 /DNA_ORIENTATION=-
MTDHAARISSANAEHFKSQHDFETEPEARIQHADREKLGPETLDELHRNLTKDPELSEESSTNVMSIPEDQSIRFSGGQAEENSTRSESES